VSCSPRCRQPDLGSTKAGNVAPTRIVTVDLRTYRTKQYLYLLDNPATTGDANSEITALSSTKFLVDERDGNFEPFAQKALYEVDINGATDVSGLTIGRQVARGVRREGRHQHGAHRAHRRRCPGRAEAAVRQRRDAG